MVDWRGYNNASVGASRISGAWASSSSASYTISGVAHGNVAEIATIAKANLAEVSDFGVGGTAINKAVIFYQREDNNAAACKIGSIDNDGDISWGSEQVLNHDDSYSEHAANVVDCCFNPSDGKVYFVWNLRDSSNNWKGYVTSGTIDASADTISFSSDVTHAHWDADNAGITTGHMFYDSVIGEVCLAAFITGEATADKSNIYSFEVGTNPTIHDRGPFPSDTALNQDGVVWCNQHGEANSANTIIIAYREVVSGDTKAMARAGTSNSDRSITWGTAVGITGEDNTEYLAVAYDEGSGKGMICYTVTASGVTDSGVYVSFDLDGTTLTTSSSSEDSNGKTGYSDYITGSGSTYFGLNAVYYPPSGEILFIYRDESYSYGELTFRPFSVRLNDAGSDRYISATAEVDIFATGSTTSTSKVEGPGGTRSPDRFTATYADLTYDRILIGWRRADASGTQSYLTALHKNSGQNWGVDT
jgi:hypothetical protein